MKMRECLNLALGRLNELGEDAFVADLIGRYNSDSRGDRKIEAPEPTFSGRQIRTGMVRVNGSVTVHKSC